MPLRAVSNSGNVHAFEYDAQHWAELKGDYKRLNLRIPATSTRIGAGVGRRHGAMGGLSVVNLGHKGLPIGKTDGAIDYSQVI